MCEDGVDVIIVVGVLFVGLVCIFRDCIFVFVVDGVFSVICYCESLIVFVLNGVVEGSFVCLLYKFNYGLFFVLVVMLV